MGKKSSSKNKDSSHLKYVSTGKDYGDPPQKNKPKKKAKREESRSIRNSKKKKNHPLRNLLENFPRNAPVAGDSESELDSLYESRKLVARQVVHERLKTADSDSESWTDIENRFSEIYEPIPARITMETWRSLSKDQIMDRIQSSRMRSEMKYMSRSEILRRIETLKRSLENRIPRERGKSDSSVLYEEIRDPYARGTPEIYESGSVARVLRGQSLSDIFQAKLKARQQVENQQRMSSTYVTRALIHENPTTSYTPGNDIRHGKVNRPEMKAKLRQRKLSLSSEIRSLDGDSSLADQNTGWDCSSSCLSCSECDDCSVCSCCSCESIKTVVSVKPRDRTPEPVPLKEVKRRKQEIERLRVMEEQERRLRQLVNVEHRKILEPNQDLSSRSKTGKRSQGSDQQGQKRIQMLMLLKSKLKESLDAEGDPRLLELRHQELKDLLKEVLDSESDSLSNISLGLIYVPMDENGKNYKTVPLQEPIYEYDTFGSIDSVIFQPKAPSTEDILEVQEEVDEHFQYLHNEEYGSGAESLESDMSILQQGSSRIRNMLTRQESEPGLRDSENYTAIDTDASWDYMDGRETKSECEGNFYRRESPVGPASVDDAAKLMELLTVSEIPFSKTVASGSVTSFAEMASQVDDSRQKGSPTGQPEDRVKSPGPDPVPAAEAELQMYGTRHGEPLYGARNAGFLLAEFVKKNYEGSEIYSPTSGPQKTGPAQPELVEQQPVDETESSVTNVVMKESAETTVDPVITVPKPNPPKLFGLPKSDTMIRELKQRLRERFHVDSASECDDPPLNITATDLSTDGSSTVAYKKELLAPKLNKIFGSLALNAPPRIPLQRPGPSFATSTAKKTDPAVKDPVMSVKLNVEDSVRLKDPSYSTPSEGSYTGIDPPSRIGWYQHPDFSVKDSPRDKPRNVQRPQDQINLEEQEKMRRMLLWIHHN